MSGILRDNNRVPYSSLDSFHIEICAPTAFAGGTTNARGDDGGTSDPFTLFTVTGDVLVGVYGVCTTDLASAGGGTLAIGVTGNTGGLIAASTATAIDQNDVWDSTTVTDVGIKTIDALTFYRIVGGLDIIETVGTADITSGNVRYTCLWRPLSKDGLVAATVPYNP